MWESTCDYDEERTLQQFNRTAGGFSDRGFHSAESRVFQYQMADIAPRTVINEIIHGKRKLNRRHIERLCRKYRVSADLFIGNPPTAGEAG